MAFPDKPPLTKWIEALELFDIFCDNYKIKYLFFVTAINWNQNVGLDQTDFDVSKWCCN